MVDGQKPNQVGGRVENDPTEQESEDHATSLLEAAEQESRHTDDRAEFDRTATSSSTRPRLLHLRQVPQNLGELRVGRIVVEPHLERMA